MKIDHINIVVSNIEKAEEFFVDLGFEPRKEAELEGDWINKLTGLDGVKAEYVALGLPGQNVDIELLQYFNPAGGTDEEISKPNRIGFRHLALEVNNIETLTGKLKDKGITFLGDVQDNGRGKKLCYFLGPEGIIIELAQYSK